MQEAAKPKKHARKSRAIQQKPTNCPTYNTRSSGGIAPKLGGIDAAGIVSAGGAASSRGSRSTVGCAIGSNSAPAGVLRAAGSFGMLVVLNSGHLVPMNQPWAALEMIRALLAPERTFEGMCDAGTPGRR